MSSVHHADSPNEIDMDNLESEDELINTPIVSPILDSDDESDNSEVIGELEEYGKAGNFYPNRIINNHDGEDLAFTCMIGFRKFVAYFDPFLPINIIMRKAYNTIMVEGLERTGRNLVTVVRDIYVFVGSFIYITYFVVLEDIGEFIGTSSKYVDSSNAIHALDSPYLLVLIIETSQSRQHVDTSLIRIESRKSPTKSLFDVGSRRVSIVTVNTKEYHSDVLAIITRIMHRTL
ncbi:hypothetical protein Tco_0436134 [Tanacetum coccineum]